MIRYETTNKRGSVFLSKVIIDNPNENLVIEVPNGTIK